MLEPQHLVDHRILDLWPQYLRLFLKLIIYQVQHGMVQLAIATQWSYLVMGLEYS